MDQFWHFLNKEQRDPRLNEILYPHCTITMAQDYINIYETKVGMADKGERELVTACLLQTTVMCL